MVYTYINGGINMTHSNITAEDAALIFQEIRRNAQLLRAIIQDAGVYVSVAEIAELVVLLDIDSQLVMDYLTSSKPSNYENQPSTGSSPQLS